MTDKKIETMRNPKLLLALQALSLSDDKKKKRSRRWRRWRRS
jgi:hypothetical protein